jgi:hypothetical protein
VNGTPVAARVSLIYYRRGRESWWQLLPLLGERFHFGKSPLFGSWLLVVCALLVAGVWAASLRLLGRELR